MSSDLVLYFNTFNRFDDSKKLRILAGLYTMLGVSYNYYDVSSIVRQLLDTIQNKQQFFINSYNAYSQGIIGDNYLKIFDVAILPYYLNYFNTYPIQFNPQIINSISSNPAHLNYFINQAHHHSHHHVLNLLNKMHY